METLPQKKNILLFLFLQGLLFWAGLPQKKNNFFLGFGPGKKKFWLAHISMLFRAVLDISRSITRILRPAKCSQRAGTVFVACEWLFFISFR